MKKNIFAFILLSVLAWITFADAYTRSFEVIPGNKKPYPFISPADVSVSYDKVTKILEITAVATDISGVAFVRASVSNGTSVILPEIPLGNTPGTDIWAQTYNSGTSLAPGVYYLTLIAEDNLGNNSGSNYANIKSFAVQTDSSGLTLTADPAFTIGGGTINFSGELTSGGTALAGKAIKLFQSASLIGTVQTDAQGRYSFDYKTPTGYSCSTFSVTAKFDGDSLYSAVSSAPASYNYLTRSSISIFSIKPITGARPGSVITFEATLINTGNTLGLSGKTIHFFDSLNNEIGTAVTMSGKAVLNYTLSPETPPNTTLSFRAEFNGDSCYSASSKTGNLILSGRTCQISDWVITPSIVIPGMQTSVSAVVTDTISNTPIGNVAAVMLYDNSASPQAAICGTGPGCIPDMSGKFQANYIAQGPANGTHNIYAYYSDNSHDMCISSSGQMSVYKPTKISSFNIYNASGAILNSVKKNTTVYIKATVKDLNNVALSGQNVEFYRDNNLLGSAVTNASGVASLAWSFGNSGSFTVKGKMLTDYVKEYYESSATKAFTVTN